MNILNDNTTGNSSLSETPNLDTYPEYSTNSLVWKIVPPILLVLGTAGNSLSILVLRRKAIRTSTTALYLTVLAFSDLIVLYTGLLRQWLVYCFGIDVRTLSEIGCKVHIWMVYSFLDFSAWILILVTLERVIAVWLPLRAKDICTQCSASVCLVSICAFVLLLNSHMLYGFGFVTSGERVRCYIDSPAYTDFFNTTWSWIDLCAFSVIPCIVILTGNTLILSKLIGSRNNIRLHVSTNRAGRHSQLTVVLLSLNAFFLISTCPISIFSIGYPYWSDTNNAQANARLDFWWSIVTMLMYSNNVFNFLLYCLTGTKFRQEVKRVFCQKKHVANTTSTQLSNIGSSTDSTESCTVTSQQILRYRFLPK